MAIEHISCGVIPVRRQGRTWEVFLVQHHLGHWSFAKGHQEAGESNEQTARRELAEETGITDVDLYTEKTFIEDYRWTKDGQENHKNVTFYLGLVEEATIVIQKSELADGRWIPIDEAEEVLTFAETQEVFRQARKVLLKEHLWE